jgi:hypothetical protein
VRAGFEPDDLQDTAGPAATAAAKSGARPGLLAPPASPPLPALRLAGLRSASATQPGMGGLPLGGLPLGSLPARSMTMPAAQMVRGWGRRKQPAAGGPRRGLPALARAGTVAGCFAHASP